MKVNKSSEECAKLNLANAECIAVGLQEAVEPNDQVLASEKAEAGRKAAGFKLQTDKLSVLKMLDPQTDGNKVRGIRARIEAIYTGANNWSSGHHTGWKLILSRGYGDDKKWLKIGDGTVLGMSTAQLAKAIEKLNELVEIQQAVDTKNRLVQNDQMRTESFIKENPEFCKMVGHSYFNDGATRYHGTGMNRLPSYNTAFIYTSDEKVKIGSETFTVAQWTEIYNLRAAQAEAMKNLKASFATVPVAA